MRGLLERGRKGRRSLVISGAILCAIGVVCAGIGAAVLSHASTMSQWPAARANVEARGIDERTRTSSSQQGRRQRQKTEYVGWIRYRFDVGGHAYMGRHSLPGSSSQANAESRLERYPVGSACEVFYDPTDPVQNAMDRSSPWIGGAFCLGFSLLWFAAGGVQIRYAVRWGSSRLAVPVRIRGRSGGADEEVSTGSLPMEHPCGGCGKPLRLMDPGLFRCPCGRTIAVLFETQIETDAFPFAHRCDECGKRSAIPAEGRHRCGCGATAMFRSRADADPGT